MEHFLGAGALLRLPFWLASLCLALYAGLLLTEALLRSPPFTRFAWLPRMPQLILLGGLLRSPVCLPCCALLQQIYPRLCAWEVQRGSSAAAVQGGDLGAVALQLFAVALAHADCEGGGGFSGVG
ncbi:hypothetical protein DBL07_22185, partial [Achromobacter mucicolens]